MIGYGDGFDIGQLMAINSCASLVFLGCSLSLSLFIFQFTTIIIISFFVSVIELLLALQVLLLTLLPVPLGQCGRGLSKQLCHV